MDLSFMMTIGPHLSALVNHGAVIHSGLWFPTFVPFESSWNSHLDMTHLKPIKYDSFVGTNDTLPQDRSFPEGTIKVGSHLSKLVYKNPYKTRKNLYYTDYHSIMTPGNLEVRYRIDYPSPSKSIEGDSFNNSNSSNGYLGLVQMLEQSYTYQSYLMNKLSFCQTEYNWIKEVYYKKNYDKLVKDINNYVDLHFSPYERKLKMADQIKHLNERDWVSGGSQSFKFLSNALMVYWLQMRDILRSQLLDLTGQDYSKNLDLNFKFDESDPSLKDTTYHVTLYDLMKAFNKVFQDFKFSFPGDSHLNDPTFDPTKMNSYKDWVNAQTNILGRYEAKSRDLMAYDVIAHPFYGDLKTDAYGKPFPYWVTHEKVLDQGLLEKELIRDVKKANGDYIPPHLYPYLKQSSVKITLIDLIELTTVKGP